MHEPSYCQTRTANYASLAAEEQPCFSLRILNNSRELKLTASHYSIGTARNNHLVLSDPYVSKHHCSLIWRQNCSQNCIWVQDEGSRNGTWVNNIRVDRGEVHSWSHILLGRTVLQLVKTRNEQNLSGIVGHHPCMLKVFSQIQKIGRIARPILIQGETGTGKELVAQAIHQCSSYKNGPFEPINCGAIPQELAEAELFGHVQGAFTGATKERRGAFERAEGGTLFLDEIGELPLALQPKILRALEEGVIQRIGDETRRKINVRVVAATNRNLNKEVELGHFRLDLYHRLAVGILWLPPLRDRREDIPLLVQHFINQSDEIASLELDSEVIPFLQSQPWPGNVRELRNAIYRAALEAGPHLTIKDFLFLQKTENPTEKNMEGVVRYAGRSFQEIKHEVYYQVLRAYKGNRSTAAIALGIPKSTFFDQVRRMGLQEKFSAHLFDTDA